MTLIDIIQQIPAFITEQIKASKDGSGQAHMVGKFHLGLQYDMNIWIQNQQCGIFPCQEEKDNAQLGGSKRKGLIDVYTVVTESILLYLEPDQKIKNVARLIAWFTLPTLEQIKRNMDSPNSLSFIWRKLEDAGAADH